jgi:hypothetical protein
MIQIISSFKSFTFQNLPTKSLNVHFPACVHHSWTSAWRELTTALAFWQPTSQSGTGLKIAAFLSPYSGTGPSPASLDLFILVSDKLEDPAFFHK